MSIEQEVKIAELEAELEMERDRVRKLGDRANELGNRLLIANHCIEGGRSMNEYRRKLNIYLDSVRRAK